MKWLIMLVLGVLIAISWKIFDDKGKEVKGLRDEIYRIENIGDPDGVLQAKKNHADSVDNEKIFTGVMLTFLSAGFIGIFLVVYILPAFAHRVTHAVYDSAEMMEHDVMHDARSLLAQGDFEGAIEGFKKAAEADPLNRLPWVEIAKIYKDNLHDPVSAIQTIRHALERQEWEVNDAAYFLFRLAELYDEVEGDRASAVSIMNQVVEHFPGTRHAANATHKLHEWSARDAAKEEEEYLAGLAAAGQPSEVPVVYELPPVDDGDEPGRPG